MKKPNYTYFSNTACEYYPCHDSPRINCLFCFCPLYTLDCGGNYSVNSKNIKDCSACTLPHQEDGYDYVIKQLGYHEKQ